MRIRVTAVDLHSLRANSNRLRHEDVFDGCRSDDRMVRDGYRRIAIAVLLVVRRHAADAYRDYAHSPRRTLPWGGRVGVCPDPKSEQRFRDWDRLLLRYWDAIRMERSTRPLGNREVSQ